jgi:hypothetical protein
MCTFILFSGAEPEDTRSAISTNPGESSVEVPRIVGGCLLLEISRRTLQFSLAVIPTLAITFSHGAIIMAGSGTFTWWWLSEIILQLLDVPIT